MKTWLSIVLAQALLALHVLFTIYMLATPIVIWLGSQQGWPLVYAPAFRYGHLGILLFIAAEVLFKIPCPLMVWERRFRLQAGLSARYTTGFFDYWITHLFKIPFKAWMFNSIFSALFLISILEFFMVPIS